MSGSNVVRWAGLSTIVSGLLLAVGFLLHAPAEDAATMSSSMWALSHALVTLGALFLLLGIVGLYARQIQESGLLGLIGFVVIFASTASIFSITYFQSFIEPAEAANVPEFAEALISGQIPTPVLVILPLTFLLFPLGWILFGVGSFRANVLPRWAFIATAVGAILITLSEEMSPVLLPIGGVALGAGLVWMGSGLWSARRMMMAESAT